MTGYVYILSNPSFPGQLKIGKTTRTPEERASELSRSTGVPTPFKVEYFVRVNDMDWAEGEAHRRLGKFRINAKREFFAVDLAYAIATLRQIAPEPSSSAPQPQSSHSPRGKAVGSIGGCGCISIVVCICLMAALATNFPSFNFNSGSEPSVARERKTERKSTDSISERGPKESAPSKWESQPINFSYEKIIESDENKIILPDSQMVDRATLVSIARKEDLKEASFYFPHKRPMQPWAETKFDGVDYQCEFLVENLKSELPFILNGKVTDLMHQNLLIVNFDETDFRIRLWGITPEVKGQPSASVDAVKLLRDVGLDKSVSVECREQNDGGELEGIVTTTDTAVSLNEQLLRQGLAKLKRNCNFAPFVTAEIDGKIARAGIWQSWEPMSFEVKEAKIQEYFDEANTEGLTYRLGKPILESENSPELREKVNRRDDYQCVICKTVESVWEVDHRRAVINGGNNSMDNLATLCHSCLIQKKKLDKQLYKQRQARLRSKRQKGGEKE